LGYKEKKARCIEFWAVKAQQKYIISCSTKAIQKNQGEGERGGAGGVVRNEEGGFHWVVAPVVSIRNHREWSRGEGEGTT